LYVIILIIIIRFSWTHPIHLPTLRTDLTVSLRPKFAHIVLLTFFYGKIWFKNHNVYCDNYTSILIQIKLVTLTIDHNILSHSSCHSSKFSRTHIIHLPKTNLQVNALICSVLHTSCWTPATSNLPSAVVVVLTAFSEALKC